MMYLDGVHVGQLTLEDDLPIRVRLGDPYDGPEITLQLIPPIPDPPPEPDPREPPAAIRRRRDDPRLDRVEDPVVLAIDELRVVARGARTLVPDRLRRWVAGITGRRATAQGDAKRGRLGKLRRAARDGIHTWAKAPTGPKVLLDGVTFTAEPGQLIGVIGPSGAGKTTLLKALIGAQPPVRGGTVTYNGHHLYPFPGELRYRIGYVPQDDILHTQLRLRQALSYSAELRLAGDDRDGREQRVDQILAELHLTNLADSPIAQISGGERKRTSVAPELLTRPPVLFLDEPTTDLDPDSERRLMEFLRRLADEGRHTVLVVTHAASVLHLCHRVLVIGRMGLRGGRMAYFGAPPDALRFFGAKDFAYVYEQLREERTDWAARFAHHPDHRANVVEPSLAAAGVRPFSRPAEPVRLYRQVATLARRNIAVIRGTKWYARLLYAQAGIMALLLLFVVGTGNLSGRPGKHPRNLLIFVVIAAIAMGLVNACREIVKELPVYQRERTVGLSPGAYLMSKFLCLGGLSTVQSGILTIVVARQHGPAEGVLLPFSFIEMWSILFAATLAAVALGLAISAIVAADSTALVLVPVLLVAQLLLSNAFLDIEDRPVLAHVALVTPAYWAFSATAASTDLFIIEKQCPQSQAKKGPDTHAVPAGLACSSRWRHTPLNLLTALTMLALLTALYATAAVVALRRRDVIRV